VPRCCYTEPEVASHRRHEHTAALKALGLLSQDMELRQPDTWPALARGGEHVSVSPSPGHPQVASVGLTRRDAEAAGVAVDTYSSSLEHNDRVILEGQAAGGGIVEIHCSKDTDTIVGATVVAAGAGNIINEVTLAMQAGVGLGAVARVIHPYPTVGEGVMQAGLGYIRRHWAKLN